MYPLYKHHVTYKSSYFGNKVTLLWLTDVGFTIEEELKKLGVALNIPAFSDGRELEKEEVIESQTTASVRIHVERLTARLKKFRILKMEIPLNLHGVINQVWTVCCLLCNFSEPLIKPK